MREAIQDAFPPGEPLIYASGHDHTLQVIERSGRFLDAPEFTVLHDRGTAVNIFDRIDYSPNSKDTFHLNLFLARNRFQTPNEFDQQAAVARGVAGQGEEV